MKSLKLQLSVVLAVAVGTIVIDGTLAQVRRPRLSGAQYNTEVVKTPGTTYADEAAHQYNQQSRQQNWNQASPNQKAATFNVADSKHTTKETNKANANAAHTQNAATRHSRR